MEDSGNHELVPVTPIPSKKKWINLSELLELKSTEEIDKIPFTKYYN